MTIQPLGAPAVVKIDDPAHNPFWPKNMSGGQAPDAPAANHIDITSITFGAAPAYAATINVVTTPVNTAWTVDWGDGTAVDNVTAGTNLKAHTYADVSSGKKYVVQAASGGDTDQQTVEY
jgi:hypothetical protein